MVPRLGYDIFVKRKIFCPAKKQTTDPPATAKLLHQLHKPSYLMGHMPHVHIVHCSKLATCPYTLCLPVMRCVT